MMINGKLPKFEGLVAKMESKTNKLFDEMAEVVGSIQAAQELAANDADALVS